MSEIKTTQKALGEFVWLRLYADFFEREEIRLIEDLPNGSEYIVLYCKLMLKSMNTRGRLVLNEIIPYTLQMLATITNTNVDTVRSGIELFIRFGLMEFVDNEVFYMNEVQTLIGSETQAAVYKREQRAKQLKTQITQVEDKSWTMSKNCPDKVGRVITKDKSKITPYSSPGSGVKFLLYIINQKGYQFLPEHIQAITEWVKYKTERKETVSHQQIELTLKQLNDYQQSKQNIVYLIETSISRGYKGIMEPTKNSLCITSKDNPEIQKLELRDFLEECYLHNKIDPRTKEPLTGEQKQLLSKHFYKNTGAKFADYIYQNEVLTGISLLDQLV